jgi:adenosylhomocysteinase
MGASVIVCEIDPMRALEARMDGCEVMPALDAAERGDVFITVTGGRDVLVREHFERMKDGTMLANAGHFDVEIAVDQLAALASRRRQVLPLVEQFEVGNSTPPTRLNLLAQGRVVNLAAAEGHPAAVMDMSFANQALCVEHLAREGSTLEPRVLPVPPQIDREVARLKLASLDVRIDELTAAQRAYLTSWRS